MIDSMPLRFFKRDAEYSIKERRLPHWSQAGAIAFITWRTHDSMPIEVLDRWHIDRARWLSSHHIDATQATWREQLELLPSAKAHEFYDLFDNRWHDALDCCYGECVLRDEKLAAIVAKSLRHFDGEHYLILDFVVMPNHVHLLASFPNDETMLKQCESWKHFTATQINRKLGRKGRFWQQDGFDHLVRSEEQFDYLRRYIAANPVRAALGSGQFVHFTRTGDLP
jgi:type I restriction enzyme R subunit